MASLDWIVIFSYLAALLGLALWLGRKQTNTATYYLGGGQIPAWALATSVIATQCSTNSLLGAPAFVGFASGGGMQWLQYELAVPLAMLALCFVFIALRKEASFSIYAFLEQRQGVSCRLVAAGFFLFFRGVATGVTVYGVASVLQLVTDISYWQAVVILMSLTIVYDVFGGIKAVVYSDVIQMALLLLAIIIALFALAAPLSQQGHLLTERTTVFANDWGFSGENYGLWPMLFGGLFLYMAYYGCDQSQAQRILAAKDDKSAIRVLWLNGVCRFPLVFLYCLLGLGLAAYALTQPDFINALPKTSSGEPNINLAFPYYVLQTFPPGLVGLVLVGLFAAAMSSIDSALNSLSASSMNDFVLRYKTVSPKAQLLLSKLFTLAWGVFAIVFSFQVEAIAPTVLEVINKVGSLANGPLLAMFIAAVWAKAPKPTAVLIGFFAGFCVNMTLWLGFSQISWLWWNVFGCVVATLVSVVCGLRFAPPPQSSVKKATVFSLLAAFVVIVLISTSSQFLL